MKITKHLLKQPSKKDFLENLITLFNTKEVFLALNSKTILFDSSIEKLAIAESPVIKLNN